MKPYGVRVRLTVCMTLLTLLWPIAQSVAAPLSPRDIMVKVDQRDDGDNMIAESKMVLIDKNDNQRVRKMMIYSKDMGEDSYRMQYFLSPADVKDTGFLTYDYADGDRDDDQWLYLPDLHKTKRIATSDKSSSFMGSDFSYADMTDRVVDEWNYKILKEGEVGGSKVWLIEALPVSKVVEERYGYSKSVLFVRQDIFMVVRAVHWLTEGKKIKYMDVRKLEQIEGVWMATQRWMKTTKNKRTLHQTTLDWTNIRFNQDLQESFFTVRQLEKGI